MAKSTKIGTIPCLVCGNEFKYLTTAHMGTYPPGYPQTDPEYWAWVAAKWDVSPDDVPLDPVGWRKKRDFFTGWRDDIINPPAVD